jgi:adenylate cyclase
MALGTVNVRKGTPTAKRAGHLTGLWLALAVGVVAVLCSQAGFFYSAHVRSTDFLFRAADTAVPVGSSSDHVVVVAIDDRTLGQLGKLSSWPRSHYATVTRRLSAAGASVIAYDLLFSESAPGDDEFASEMELAGNVVLAVVETSLLRTGTPAVDVDTEPWRYERPLPVLEAAAAGTGHANVFPDADGVVRRVPLTLPSTSGSVPAFSTVVAELYVEQLGHSQFPAQAGSQMTTPVIPLDATDSMIVNYTAAVGPHTPPQVSFVDVLEGSADMSVFEGKAVLIGATAVGLQDAMWTPCGRLMSGVVVHGSAIETIISGRFLEHIAALPMALVTLGLAILAWLAVSRLSTPRALAALLGVAVLYVLAVFIAFDQGLLLHMLYPPAALVASFGTVAVHNAALERARRKLIAVTFGRFVSTPVADQILTALESGAITLGGTQREATVLFADMRGFTSVAEHLEPSRLVDVVNAYLSVAVQIVNDEGGMVNKFGGDSIMAVWNAPTDCPRHAVHAVQAALRIQTETAKLSQSDSTLPRLSFGAGVNSGKVVAGNVGAEERLEYSVLGDTVNVASRVTALTPGGSVWLTEETMRLVADRVDLQDLGCFALKGKDSPAHLFEAKTMAHRRTTEAREGEHRVTICPAGGTTVPKLERESESRPEWADQSCGEGKCNAGLAGEKRHT